jgi:DNA-binding response OmpR family regulator
MLPCQVKLRSILNRARQEFAVTQVGILIIDDDEASQSALRQVLDSEGWKVHIVPLANQALGELASGEWKLVIVNVAMTGLDGPLFSTLRELALAPPLEAGATRVRVLFLVPELAGAEAQPVLEREGLPYTLKPFHLNDFLEKVSDLLLETNAISAPIRRIRYDPNARDHGTGSDRRFLHERRSGPDRRSGRDRRETSMFAARADYMMSEEEILEFEKQEEEERKKKQKKVKELGRP